MLLIYGNVGPRQWEFWINATKTVLKWFALVVVVVGMGVCVSGCVAALLSPFYNSRLRLLHYCTMCDLHYYILVIILYKYICIYVCMLVCVCVCSCVELLGYSYFGFFHFFVLVSVKCASLLIPSVAPNVGQSWTCGFARLPVIGTLNSVLLILFLLLLDLLAVLL